MGIKYLGFYWVIEGTGWQMYDTLEEAKYPWCFGMQIFEMPTEEAERIINIGKAIKADHANDNKTYKCNWLMLEECNKYKLVYKENEPPACFIEKGI